MSKRMRALFSLALAAGGLTLAIDVSPALAQSCQLKCARCRIDEVFDTMTCTDCTITGCQLP